MEQARLKLTKAAMLALALALTSASSFAQSKDNFSAAAIQKARIEAGNAWVKEAEDRIKSNFEFAITPDMTDNSPSVCKLVFTPNGYVSRIQFEKRSVLPGFDQALELAIRKSEPFPPDATGRFHTHLTLTYRPLD